MALDLLAPETLRTRVMFAMEFVDPMTGWLVCDGLKVEAEGWGRPIRSRSGRYVWLDVEPPAQRQVKVTAKSLDHRYGDFIETIPVPEHVPNIAPSSLLFRRVLTGTRLHLPPPGLIAAAGQIKRGNPPKPLKDVKVQILLRHGSDDQGQNGSTFASGYSGVSDAEGGFVAVVTDLGDIKPDRGPDGSVVSWLKLNDGSSDKFTAILPLHPSRLTRLTPALRWNLLANNGPFGP